MSGCGIALVLALDVSGSIRAEEFALMRDAHAAGLRYPPVVRAILAEGAAVAVTQWATVPRVAIGWRVLRGAEDVARMAAEIAVMPRLASDGTNTGRAILHAAEMLLAAPCGDRQTIDLVTDGPGQDDIAPALEAIQVQGITLNALAVRDGAEWLRQVVPAPGFVVVAEGFGDVEGALRRKLVMELAAR